MNQTPYKALFPNNHIVVEIDGKYFIIDTGSPFSFSFEGDSTIIIDGQAYDMQPPLFAGSEANVLTGLEISGFVGMDILSETNLTIDIANEIICFDVPEAYTAGRKMRINIFNLRGQRYVRFNQLIINGNELKDLFLDIGASISYVSSEYLAEADVTSEEYHDISPEIGEISGYLYSARFKTGPDDEEVETKVGEMPGIYNLITSAIINPMIFAKENLAFDFEEGSLYVK